METQAMKEVKINEKAPESPSKALSGETKALVKGKAKTPQIEAEKPVEAS